MNARTVSSFFPGGALPSSRTEFAPADLGDPSWETGAAALRAWFLAGKPLADHDPWRYRRSTNELVLDRVPGTHGGYEIDLDWCDDASAFWWLRHIAEKRWADDACLAGLIRALDYWATNVRPKPATDRVLCPGCRAELLGLARTRGVCGKCQVRGIEPAGGGSS